MMSISSGSSCCCSRGKSRIDRVCLVVLLLLTSSFQTFLQLPSSVFQPLSDIFTGSISTYHTSSTSNNNVISLLVSANHHNSDTSSSNTNNLHEHNVRQTLALRQQSIRRFALAKQPAYITTKLNTTSARVSGNLPHTIKCPRNRFLILTEYQFGRDGNNMIEFANTLYMAEKLQATLVIPSWMNNIFIPFNTTLLDSLYCYTFDMKTMLSSNKADNTNSNIVKFEITSEESFFLFQVLFNPKHALMKEIELTRQHCLDGSLSCGEHVLQQYASTKEGLVWSNDTLQELSLHYAQVYASFWSQPHMKLLSTAEYFIRHYLQHHFQYSAVHKRKLEGGCNAILSTNTQLADYSMKELPMSHPEWHGNLRKAHPLCDMTYSFVWSTLSMHHRNASKLFVAYDGSGDVSDYPSHHAVFTSILSKQHPEIHLNLDYKYLDMFLAIHSDFFIQNPRSTFSWQIFVIRTILSLTSVPMIRNNDIFLQDLNKEKRSHLWVNWFSLTDAVLKSR